MVVKSDMGKLELHSKQRMGDVTSVNHGRALALMD